MLNSIGLANPGRERVPRRDAAAAARARRSAVGLRRRLLRRTSTPRRARQLDDVEAIELNLSCPNVDEAAETAAEIVAACRAATALPLYAKLSPATWDSARSRAPSRPRAPTGSRSSTRSAASRSTSGRSSRVSRPRSGGLSGPALKPIALAAVLRVPARDRAADRRHGRRHDRTRRARADRVRRDGTSRSARCSSPTRTRRRESARSSPQRRRALGVADARTTRTHQFAHEDGRRHKSR